MAEKRCICSCCSWYDRGIAQHIRSITKIKLECEMIKRMERKRSRKVYYVQAELPFVFGEMVLFLQEVICQCAHNIVSLFLSWWDDLNQSSKTMKFYWQISQILTLSDVWQGHFYGINKTPHVLRTESIMICVIACLRFSFCNVIYGVDMMPDIHQKWLSEWRESRREKL